MDLLVGPCCADLQWLAVDISKRGLLEMEFLDINLTKNSSLLLTCSSQSHLLEDLKKTYFSLVLKFPTKKSAKQENVESIPE